MTNFNPCTFVLSLLLILTNSTFSFAGAEPVFGIIKGVTTSQFALCWLPGEKPAAPITINGTSTIVKSNGDCYITSGMTLTAPYVVEVDSKVYKYDAGGLLVAPVAPFKFRATKGSGYQYTFDVVADQIPAAGFASAKINGVDYPVTKIGTRFTTVADNIVLPAGKMVVELGSKRFSYQDAASNIVVAPAEPRTMVSASYQLETEWDAYEMPKNMTSMKIDGVDYTGSIVGNRFVLSATSFATKLSSKMVMTYRGVTKSFDMAATTGTLATLRQPEVPVANLYMDPGTTSGCGKVELTWSDGLEMPSNLKSISVNDDSSIGTVTGTKFSTNVSVTCASNNTYTLRVAGLDDPIIYDATLPIELSSFDANYDEDYSHTMVEWTTELEVDLERFEVQRALESDRFETIHTIYTKGETTESSAYQYIDNDLPFNFSGWAYYRLKAIDLDGSSESFDVVSVYIGGRDIKGDITAFPNPASESVNIKTEQAAGLTLFNSNGAQVLTATLEPGISIVDLNNLPMGNYFGKFIKVDGSVSTIKIQKIN